jgi:P pilus assembly chaperone PapD
MTPRWYLTLPLAAALILIHGPVALAQLSLEASPMRVEIEAEPGTSHTRAVTLTNPGTQTIRVRATLADWYLARDGSPQFDAPEPGRAYAASGWVRFAPPEFLLEAGKQGTVRFTLSVPADAQPGGYRTGLLFEFLPDTPEESSAARQVRLRSRIATLVYVNVGRSAPAVDLTNMQVRNAAQQTQIVAALKNTSRRTVRTRGTLMLYDGSGVSVAQILVPDVPILPESERELAIAADEAIKPLIPGSYRVELKLDLGMPALVVGETTLRVTR